MSLQPPPRGTLFKRLGFGLLGLIAAAVAVALIATAASSPSRPLMSSRTAGAGASLPPARAPRPRTAASSQTRPPFAIGLRTLTLIDRSRTIRLPGGASTPRRLVTVVRYPASGAPGEVDLPGAPPLRSAGPFPLVVFGHGFDVTPAIYAGLLRAWARAGYVVAAPVFPLENAEAPGGPNETDLINQPADLRFVISRLLDSGTAARGPLAGMVDPRRIAVAGHSDGGETALVVAYDGPYRDSRIRAAVILSGAQPPNGGLTFPHPSPALLALQGTSDPILDPGASQRFFDLAPSPKYLIRLLGAGHLAPYTTEQPQLGVVEQATIAFLDVYLKGKHESQRRLTAAGSVPGVTTLEAGP